jgi:nitroimidazol reductase NimA-like FMN-containing flavoprotein (pyridoxamine 5'-phosphate oxidase superfamily)
MPMTSSDFPASERSRLRRQPGRGCHDRELIHAILDEGLVCHVGVVVEGRPVVIPMAYGRDGDRLILHGAVASRLMTTLAEGAEVCVSVTLVDGLVLARSTFHSSLNYRSVVAFGTARRIRGDDARRAALETLVEHIVPGRSQEARASTEAELKATEVVELRIEEATAKVRSGPPKEPETDRNLPVWAGVLPLSLSIGTPEPAPDLTAGLSPSEVVTRWRRP